MLEGQQILQTCGEGKNLYTSFQFSQRAGNVYVFFNEASGKYICRSSAIETEDRKFLVAQTDFDLDECSLEIHDLDIWERLLEENELYFGQVSLPPNTEIGSDNVAIPYFLLTASL